MLVLLFIHLNTWRLIGAHIPPESLQWAYWIGVGNLVQIALPAIIASVLFWKKKAPHGILFLIMMASQVAFLALVMFAFPAPTNVEIWIFSPFLARMFALGATVPAIFYAALYFASAPRRKKPLFTWISCVLGMVLPPAIVYASGWIFFTLAKHVPFRSWLPDSLGTTLIVILAVALTFIMGVACLRMIVLLFLALQKKPFWRDIFLPLVIALIFPISGLILNRTIPFPVDFQAWSVYVLTVFNALILMLPASGKHARWVWAARWATLPFTLYFFIVFLPFLPLSIPAILAAGCGFLILSPTLLFMLHLLRIKEAYTAARNTAESSKRRHPATVWIIALVSISLIPAWIVGETLFYRSTLYKAIDYVYLPDTARPMRFDGDSTTVIRSLNWLQDYKDGLYYPILSPLRAHILFNGMVLSDTKIADLRNAFSGESQSPVIKSRHFSPFAERRRMSRAGPPRRTPAFSDRQLSIRHEATQETLGQDTLSTVTITLSNPLNSNGEFAGQLNLSPGLQIIGATYTQNGQTLAAHIIEQKTALWIYQKIVEYRRDPLLLYFAGPNTVQLRAFPIPAHKDAVIRLSVRIPAHLPAALTLTEAASSQRMKTQTLLRIEGSQNAVAVAQNSHTTALLAADWQTLIKTPATVRTPILHLLIDNSTSGAYSSENLLKTLGQLSESHGAQTQATLAWLNNEIIPIEDGRVYTLAHWQMLFAAATPPVRPSAQGGLLFENATLHIGYHYQETALKKEGAFLQYPQIVLLTQAGPHQRPRSFDWPFADVVPEAPRPSILSPNDTLPAPSAIGVFLVAVGEVVRPLCATVENTQTTPAAAVQSLVFNTTASHAAYWDDAQKTWIALPALATDAAHDPWAEGLLNQARALGAAQNPALRNDLLPEILATARATKALAPLTAYIAVETSAQQEKMKRAQNQALNSSSALDFDEGDRVPMSEPALWLCGGLAMLIGWWSTRRKSKRA